MNQESRNLRLVLLLTALTVATVVAYFLVRDQDKVLVDPAIFKVTELDKVDGVLLEKGERKVKLTYDSNNWKVDGRFPADHQLVTVLFATLKQAVPKRPVALSKIDSINSILAQKGIKVSLFTDGRLVSTFLAGGDASKKEAWFRHVDEKQPYIMTIPGYRVYVSQILDLDGNGWRDKRIFEFRWRNFIGLHSIFPGDPKGNFDIAMADKYFSVVGAAHADTARVNTFLDDISLLRADQIIPSGSSPQYDSLVKTSPVNRIEVKDIAGRSFSLNLYMPLAGETVILGLAHDREMMLFDREKIYRVVKKRAWFVPKAE